MIELAFYLVQLYLYCMAIIIGLSAIPCIIMVIWALFLKLCGERHEMFDGPDKYD